MCMCVCVCGGGGCQLGSARHGGPSGPNVRGPWCPPETAWSSGRSLPSPEADGMEHTDPGGRVVPGTSMAHAWAITRPPPRCGTGGSVSR